MNINDFSKKSISELKKIADNNKIKYDSKIKKDHLIKLILENNKLNETAETKEKEISGNQASSINQPYYEERKDIFKDIKNLPEHYNKDKLVFMVRDPYWAFTYWEISDCLKNNHNLFTEEKYLRVYDITDSNNQDKPDYFFDIKLTDIAQNWYIKLPKANSTYFLDFGYFKDGKFINILRSNVASSPRDSISDKIDVEWMMPDEDYRRLLEASGANKMFQQIGSMEMMKFLSGNVSEENNNSSGGLGLSSSSPMGASFSK
jgi:hypothetical protein